MSAACPHPRASVEDVISYGNQKLGELCRRCMAVAGKARCYFCRTDVIGLGPCAWCSRRQPGAHLHQVTNHCLWCSRPFVTTVWKLRRGKGHIYCGRPCRRRRKYRLPAAEATQ